MDFSVERVRSCVNFGTMQFCRLRVRRIAAVLLALAVLVPISARAATTKTHPARARHTTARSNGRSRKLHRTAYRGSRYSRRYRRRHRAVLGQRVMDAQRAIQIQQALVAAHYLSGAPTGQWDTATQAAMEKYQADNGWQTKITPDSRALIKLGLGPKQDDGEYATAAAGVSKTSGGGSGDPLSTMATSEMPAADSQN